MVNMPKKIIWPGKFFKLDSVKIRLYIITWDKLNTVKINANFVAQNEMEKEYEKL